MSPVPVIGTQAVQPPLLAADNQASVCLYARSGAGTGALCLVCQQPSVLVLELECSL